MSNGLVTIRYYDNRVFAENVVRLITSKSRFIYGGVNNNISKTDSYDWCGEAWNQIDHNSVVRCFKKLGITTTRDGSEGHLVNIPKLPEYEMPTDYMQNEFTVDSEGESDTSLELSSEDSDSDTCD